MEEEEPMSNCICEYDDVAGSGHPWMRVSDEPDCPVHHPESPVDQVLREVHDERTRQDMKWQVQNHPDFFLPSGTVKAIRMIYRERAELYKSINTDRVKAQDEAGVPPDRNCAWDSILLEEVFEALSEEDPEKMCEELIQVAAVAVAWVQCKRRGQQP